MLEVAATEEDFRWVLELHPTLYPYDRSRAQKCSSAVEEYGALLAKQLDITGIFSGFETLLEEMDIVVMDIQDRGQNSSLHRLHWEVLEYSCAHNRPYMPRLLVRRLVQPKDSPGVVLEDTSTNPVQRHWNILMVVARPDKGDDIDPFLGTNALCQIQRMMRESRANRTQADLDFHNDDGTVAIEMQKYLTSYEIDFEVARPGSWRALKELLQMRTEQWRQKGGSGAWFDLVHFDVHGALWNGEAHLVFSTTSGQQALWKEALKIGRLMKRHDISRVLLNSCNSAHATSNHLSNLARTLVESGVRTVVAMRFKFTSSAASLFNMAFYCRLFQIPSPPDLLSALMAARGALWRFPKRTGRLNQTVEIPDYIVPVLYVGTEQASVCLPWRHFCGEPYKVLSNIENVVSSDLATQVAKKWVSLPSSIHYGRQQEIVELEWLLLRSHRSNVVLMNGMVGSGKTLLTNLLASWWKQTALIQSFQSLCARSTNFEQIISALRRLQNERLSLRSDHRRLLVIDHLDVATIGFRNDKDDVSSIWADGKKSAFVSLIQSFVGEPDFVILVARQWEPWLEVPKSQVYHLGGLANYYANELASKTLHSAGLQDAVNNEKEKDHIQYLTSRLLYNPAAIAFFLEGMIISAEKWPHVRQYMDRPSKLFGWLTSNTLNGIVYSDSTTSPLARECFFFIANLIESEATGTTKIRTMILSLAPCGSVFHRSWIDRLMRKVHDGIPHDDWRRTMIPTRGEFHHFLETVLLRSGWFEEFELPLPGGEMDRYIRIHPIFTNTVRTLPLMQEGQWWQKFPKDVLYIFGNYSYEKIQQHLLGTGEMRDISTIPGTEIQRAVIAWESLRRETTLRVQVEAANYLQGSMQLAREGEYIDANVILIILWDVAVRSQTPALSMEMLLPTVTNFRLTLKKLLSSDLAEKEPFRLRIVLAIVELSARLTNHYIQAAPRMAMQLAEDGLRLAFRHGGQIGSLDAYTLERIVLLLLSYGLSLLQLGKHFEQAREAFFTALRFAHYMETPRFPPLVAFVTSFGLEAVNSIIDYDKELEQILSQVQNSALLHLSAQDKYRVPNLSFADLGAYLLESFFGYQSEVDLTVFLRHIRSSINDSAVISAIKDQALLQSSQGQMKGDAMLECRGQMILAELAMESKDWEAAREHIFSVDSLRLRSSGGSLLFNSPADRAFLWMRYGCVMLRNSELKNALLFFKMSESDRDGMRLEGDGLEDVESAEEFMDVAVERTRRCLNSLLSPPRALIGVAEYYELDDLMQSLVIEKLEKRFPKYNMEEHDTKMLLKRQYTLHDEEQELIKIPERSEYVLKTTLLSLANLSVDQATAPAEENFLDLSGLDKLLPSTEEAVMRLAVEVSFWLDETVVVDDPGANS